MTARPRALGAAAVAAALLAAAGPRAATMPGRVVVLDAFADPFGAGHFGALFEVDPWSPPADPAVALSSSATFYQASDLAFRDDGAIVVVDRDADPSGFGPDPNGDPGPGAILLAPQPDQVLGVLADGSDYPAGLPPPAQTAFVDPRGVAVIPGGPILVADLDADPSALGPDTAGFAGHGALFAVSPTGSVSLVSDGSLSDDGPPPRGAASWFEDPGSACVTADGRIFVLDLFGDPLAIGGRGAVFEVHVATGSVRLVAVSPSFVAPVAVAERAPGRLLITDQLADLYGDGSRGAVFEVDLSQPDPRLAVTLAATHPRFRGPAGMGLAADGSMFIADPFADPLALGRIGGIFRLLPDGEMRVASSASESRSPVSVRAVPPAAPAPSLAGVVPPAAEAGASLTLTFSGSGFAAPAEARLGAGIAVSAVRVVSPDAAEVDVTLDAAAVAGAREATLVNGDLQAASLPAGFTVLERARPEVLACDPPAGVQGTVIDVAVTGDRFTDGASVDLGPGVTVRDLLRVDATRLELVVDVGAAAAPGARDVVVTNPDLLAGTLAGGFTVLAPAPPAPTRLTPAGARPGEVIELSMDGSGFEPGMTVDLGAGVLVGPLDVSSSFLATFRVAIHADAVPGPRDAVATNPGGATGTLGGALVIEDVPRVRVVALTADDASGNASGHPDPGETVSLHVLGWNEGPRPLVNPAVRVSAAPGSGVTLLRAAVTLGSGDAGPLRRTGAPHLEAHVEPSVACGSSIALHVELLENGAPVAARDLDLLVGEPASHGRKPHLAGDLIGGARGAAVALADLDGDGSADLVAGAPRESPAGVFAAGRVVSVSGATDDPLWSRDGLEANGRFGAALASAGDLDGDGRDELLVGAPGEAGGNGRVWLLAGDSGAVLASVPGDASSGLGASLALTGDMDLDGWPEVLAGAPGWAGGAGSARLLRLPDLVELRRLEGQPGDDLGRAVAGLGDRDGDGLADAAVGAPGAAGSGQVILWHGDGSVATLDGLAPGERFGASLAGGADADVDGVPDLLVGAPGADVGPLARAGRAELVSGRDLARRMTLGSQAAAECGLALAFAGDLDGDGAADLAIGEPGAFAGDGLVALRAGRDLRLLRPEPGAAGLESSFGAALAGPARAGGDGFVDLAVGAPGQPEPGLPLAGRAMMLKTVATCSPVFACMPDALEPNDPSQPTVIAHGEWTDLTICRADVDAFRIDLAPGRRALALVRFRHADGDLDATLHDGASGAVLDQSLSLDDDEELGPFGPGGSFELRVFGYDDATNAYGLLVLDPDSCPPTLELAGLRVAKRGRIVMTWAPSADPCHAPSPGRGYRVWEAPSPGPSGPPGPFPAGSAFVDVTDLDADGDVSNPAYQTTATGSAFWLVTDVGRGGEDGPAGWPATP